MVDPDDFASSIVDANGQHIFVAEAGEGPLVLLLHGFPESWFSWRHQMIALRDAGYRAVAMSGRGYGQSSRPEDASSYRITELVADCVGVVEELGESSCVIIGHDWGAQVAWASAWTRPDVFTAVAAMGVPFGGRTLLTLPAHDAWAGNELPPSEIGRRIAGQDLVFYRDYLATPGVPEREMEADVRGWLRDAYFTYSGSVDRPTDRNGLDVANLSDDEIIDLARQGPGCINPGARWRDRFHPAPTPFPPWLEESTLDFYAQEFERTGFTGAINWYRNADANWELLAPYDDANVEVPALYIEGTRDPATMLLKNRAEDMAARVPDLRIRVIAGCGHWIGEERPRETNGTLLEFVTRVRPRTRAMTSGGTRSGR